jgi:hypothetical protein
MAGIMSFVQESGRRSQTLRFEPDRLVLVSADDAQASELSLAYHDVDVKRGEVFRERRAWFARRRATRFALMAPRRRREWLEIWGDAQHDRIIAELTARWAEARRRLVCVDFSADPLSEIERFRALCERGLIDAGECAAAIARIVSAQ